MDDPFDDIDKLRLKPDGPQAKAPYVPARIRKQRRQFIMVPWMWLEKLAKAPMANGAAHQVAWHLLYSHFKSRGKPFRLPNGWLRYNGIDRWTKWRCLNDLERRGLILIERRNRKSPVIRVLLAD
jgi:hypothetical protein